MKNRQKILFVHNQRSSFVLTDFELLSQHYEVQEWYQKGRVVNLFKLFSAVQRCDLVYGWFASWHTLWPVLLAQLLGKPSLIVAGGYDVASVPEIHYGSQQRPGLRRSVARMTLRFATHLTVSSIFLGHEATHNALVSPEKITPIHLAVDTSNVGTGRWSKERLVLTVGNIAQENLWRKGHLPLVQAAHLLPEVDFVFVGRFRDDAVEQLRAEAPPNVTFTGYISDQELLALQARAKVYAQVSRHEGFGVAVIEAMLAGCIPVVTRIGALPEVVGDAGVYAETQTPEVIAQAIAQALALDETAAHKAQQHVLERYSLEKRQEALLQLVETTIINKRQ